MTPKRKRRQTPAYLEHIPKCYTPVEKIQLNFLTAESQMWASMRVENPWEPQNKRSLPPTHRFFSRDLTGCWGESMGAKPETKEGLLEVQAQGRGAAAVPRNA